jgi:signal peptidase II
MQCRLIHLHYLSISFFVLLADQISKWEAIKYLSAGVSVVLLPVLNFTLAMNRGAAFSFLDGASGWQNTFFITLATCICAGLLVWLMRLPEEEKCTAIGVGFILGGAIGNIVDRLHYGYVIDFIDAHIGVHHWPIFNVADSAVTLGVIFFFISMCRQKK